ncbi:enoyl-CoA hydratase-related protein [Pseudohongiella spirulinae]|uniref:Enoyl-CoA hydratase n=1 Tax=Pseudohongiella spirulinae TaxID=1249552 RepID=A0A0S2KEB2_9GAMM|nr:enoyl-CoA hydratase-related protein [Pseudohongiella spirulinae]ALO46446.1 enoyl-CoA hydratase [Pseudohongiella spirulinae]
MSDKNFSDVLQIEKPASGIAEIWLNRPEKHNAFDPALIAAIHRALDTLRDDSSTRVVIIAGRGKSFCSGADLNYMKSMVNFSHAENVADAGRLSAMLQTLHRFPKPVIAAVHGNVFAGATGIVACSDFVIAADSARFCISEVKLGLVPAVISPYVMSRIGPHQARRYFLTAEVFDAAAAQRVGLVHECVADDSVMAYAHARAMEMLRNAPASLADTKTLIRELVPVPSSPELSQLTCELIARVRAGDEAQAGLQAFLDKRPAPWIADDGETA